MEGPQPPRLLAISDRRSLPPGDDPASWLRRVAAAGVAAVQLREKDLPDDELFRLARSFRALLPPPRLLLLNGRGDVALAAGADGVHLPAAGLPASEIRRLWEERGAGRRPLIGRSTHTTEEVEAALDEGVDYVTFGPVYPTPSKAPYGPPPGLEGLRRACAVGLPVLALGGVTAQRLTEVRRAGARGAAGIRVFRTAEGCRAMVAALADTMPAD